MGIIGKIKYYVTHPGEIGSAIATSGQSGSGTGQPVLGMSSASSGYAGGGTAGGISNAISGAIGGGGSGTTTSTTSAPTTTRSSGGGGGGGGGGTVQTVQQQQAQIQQLQSQGLTQQQAQARAGVSLQQVQATRQAQQTQQQFSGSVEESFKGRPQQKTYYVSGQPTGRVKYNEGKQPTAETIKPSTFTFKRGNTEEAVQFNEQGMSSATVTMQDVEAEMQSGTQSLVMQTPSGSSYRGGTSLKSDAFEIFNTMSIPIRDLYKTGKEIVKTSATPLTYTYKEMFGRSVGSDISKVGTKATGYITTAELFTLGFIPGEKKEREKQTRNKAEFNSLITDIDTFNTAYGGKELEESEYTKATSEFNSLQARQTNYEARQLYETQTKMRGERTDPMLYFAPALVKGTVAGAFELGKFGIGAVTTPTKTTTETIEGFASLPAEFKMYPASTAGSVLGGFLGQGLTIKGATKFTTGFSDLIRTSDLQELKLADLNTEMFMRRGREVYYERGVPRNVYFQNVIREFTGKKSLNAGQFLERRYSIIAPEYFAGQKYPKLRSGQTAGQLQKEFYKPDLPGEKLGVSRGYTASPSEFAKATEAQKGSSEIFGLYQAGKTSPAFLKIGAKEGKVFTWNFLSESLSPSIIKTTTYGVKLVPGVKHSQTSLASLGSSKSYIESKAPLGSSYIPFVKAEKESILPPETPLEQFNVKYYIEFEGRKVPIFQFKAGKGERVDPKELGANTYSQADISKMLSYSRVGSRATFSSANLLGLSSRGDYSRSSSAGSISSLSSPKSSSIMSSLTSVSPLKSSGSTSRSSYGSSYRSNIYSKLYSSIRTPPYSTRYNYPARPTPPEPQPLKYKYDKPYKQKPIGGVNLFQREKGLWKFKGAFRNVFQASRVGRFLTGSSINRSYKITGAKAPLLSGYRLSKKKGQQDVMVELSKYAINTPLEKSTLKEARRYAPKRNQTKKLRIF